MSNVSKNKIQGSWDHLLTEIDPPKTDQTPDRSDSVSEITLPSTVDRRIQTPVSSSFVKKDKTSVFEEGRQKVYTVSEINRVIKKQLEGQHPKLWLKGEISNFKAHGSGHYYFSLKDSQSQINGVMFKTYNRRLPFQLENGMEVVAFGKITVYEPRGQYQLFCENMEPAGAGALAKAFEQLKKKLKTQGFFDEDKKKSLPPYPREVAVITSPTGAAIKDVLNVLTRRSKRIQVTVIPTRVQGDGASQEIVKAIQRVDQLNYFDVVILTRGGGSMEDLWCFNEEEVAKAIYYCQVPLVSAVGHEIDFTISDFVADLRVPTPSAGAEIVSQGEQELREKLGFFNQSLKRSFHQRIFNNKKQIVFYQKRLVSPEKFLRDCTLRVDDWSQRLIQSSVRFTKNLRLKIQLKRKELRDPLNKLQKDRDKEKYLKKQLFWLMEQKLLHLKKDFQKKIRLLESLNPLGVLDRGYGILRSKGRVIQSVKDLSPNHLFLGKGAEPKTSKQKNTEIEVELKDGFISAEILKIKEKEKL